MTKLFTGSQLTYGTRLPSATATADGTFFYLTESYTDNVHGSGISRAPGLYLCAFQQDVNPSVDGEQVGFGWFQVTSSGTFVSKTGDVMTGPLRIESAANHGLTIESNFPGIFFRELDQPLNEKVWLFTANAGSFQLQTRDDATNSPATMWSVTRSGVMSVAGNTVWHQGNDGAGSALDADLLDGQHGSFYRDVGNLIGTLPITAGGTGSTSLSTGGILWSNGFSVLSSVGSPGQLLTSGGSGAPTWTNPISLSVGSALTAGSATILQTARNINGVPFNGSADITITAAVANAVTFNNGGAGAASGTTYNGSIARTVSYNTIGAPSTAGTGATGTWGISITGNSATVASLAPSTGATVSSIAARDSSGHLYAAYFNQSSSNSELASGSISQVIVTNGTDNFFRKASVAQLAAAVGTSYVLKTGDTMSGTLTLPTLSATTVGATTGNITTVNASSVLASGVVTGSSFTGSSVNMTGGFATSTIDHDTITLNGGSNGGQLTIQAPTGPAANVTFSVASTGSSYIFNGHTNGERFRVISSGATAAQVTGDFAATGNITAYSSDGRLKKNITPIWNAVEKVRSLGGFKYDWDLEKCAEVGFKPERETEHGLIAQEVEVVMPDAVAPAPFNPEYKTVRYDRLVALLMAAVGEQQKQIERLVDQINELKAK